MFYRIRKPLPQNENDANDTSQTPPPKPEPSQPNTAKPEVESINSNVRPERTWPVLAPEALYGIPGKVVAMFEPHTEADPVHTASRSG
jgi:hypothetical protein